MRRFAVPIVLIMLAVPLVSAQGHEHAEAPGAVIAHDAPDDGTVVVGEPTGFAVIILGEDQLPQFHQQMHIRVTLNDVELWETTPDSGHDYDGVNTFTITFPVPGHYTVELLDGDEVLASFNGTAVDGDVIDTIGPSIEAPSSAMALDPVTIGIDPGSGSAAHWDAVVEARDAQGVAWRTKVHGHDAEPRSIDVAFPEEGTYTVRSFVYSGSIEKGTAIAPGVAEATIDVAPNVDLQPDSVPTPMAPSGLNQVVVGESTGDLRIVGTYDPWTVVGPDTQQHLGVLVLDEMGVPARHVDFAARLVGPTGATLFQSDDLHEYDGVLELTTRQVVPGNYELQVQADRGDWTGTVTLQYTVIPPVQEMGGTAGPQAVAADLSEPSAGVPAQITLRAMDATGRPFTHSEVDVQVLDAATGVPVLMTKVHTHGDGTFPFTVTFPSADEHMLRLSPFPLEARPVVVQPMDVPVSVADGPGIPAPDLDVPLDAASDGEGNDLPAPGLALVLALVALAALTLRRRR